MKLIDTEINVTHLTFFFFLGGEEATLLSRV